MKIPAGKGWGIGSKLAAAVLALMLLQVGTEVVSDNRFTSKIIDIHGRAKMTEGAAALRAAHTMLQEEARQSLQQFIREPRFRAVVKLGDGPTLEAQLREMLAEQRAKIAMFTRPDGTLLATVTRPPELSAGDFAGTTAPLVAEALAGNAVAGWRIWAGRPLACVSVPVVIDGVLTGALTVGSEISGQTINQLREITGAEVAILGRERVIQASLDLRSADAELTGHFASHRDSPGRTDPVILALRDTNYFVARQPHRLEASAEAPTVALLMPAQEYISTSREFVSDSIVRNAINLVVAALLVVFLVARLTQPARTLRVATEKMAAGELAQRVPVTSGDELGQLASAFNTMAGRIAESQRELATANATLEHQVAERTRSLQEQVKRREAAELGLQHYAAELEERVRARTSEIEQALVTLDGINDATLILEVSSLRLTLANEGACLQFNQPREALLGASYPSLVAASAAADLPSILESARQRAPAVVQFTTVHLRRDGPPVPVEVNLQYSAPAGRTPCYIAIGRDISERRSLEERRNRAQRLEMLGKVASGVAHDLNNALSPIALSLDLLRAKHPGDGALLGMLEQSSRRGASMVRQLLTFARGRDGERAAIDARKLVDEMAQIVRGTFPRSIRLELDTAPGLRRINGDATQIHQVLLNLCVNARDAMPDGGALQLGARNAEVDASLSDCVSDVTPGSYVCLTVADGGTGMPAHIRSQIFDPFFTTKAPGKGSGLGLSTVLGIVRSHGGILRLQSEPGRGSRFEVYLPAALATAAVEHAAPSPAPAAVGMGGRVLVVDDEQLIREACSTALSDLGFTVVMAEDGKDALVRAREEGPPISVVITDLDMPILGGRGLIEALRGFLPNTPIIVTSGAVADEESAFLRQDPRVRAVLQKPFSLAQLAAAVGEATGRAPAGGAP